MQMPAPDAATIARRDEIAAALRRIVPGEGVIVAEPERRAYESDGLTAYRQPPLVVVLPSTVAQVAAVLRYCHDERIKVVPRGAGTSLSGGALPLADGVLLGMAKFNRILDIDYDNRCVTVQPGVTNLGISHAVAGADFYYAPDPSSQIACTIGGNVAENSGGVHCLKYGLTTNNLLGLEIVLIDGEVIRLGGKHFDSGGYDLMGIMTGSEGLLGVVTEVTVRILRKPPTARALLIGFGATEDAGNCVAAIIGAGIIPGGMEMMDRPAIHAAEDFVRAGYPRDAEALLIVELDGPEAEVDHLIAKVEAIARANRAGSLRISQSEAERLAFWAGRKAAFPAVGRISPDYYCMDGTIPRARLAEVLRRTGELSAQYGLRVANVFHAGDGNLHPLILYDANRPGEIERAEAFGADILRLCVEVGGVLTGEHGVGVEKRDLMGTMFDETDLAHQERLKCAFDPDGLLNPGKVFPTLHRCAELGRLHVHAGRLPHPDLPRF
jgi:glycolate oxidase